MFLNQLMNIDFQNLHKGVSMLLKIIRTYLLDPNNIQAISIKTEGPWEVQVEQEPFQVSVAEEHQDYKRILEEVTVWALEHNLTNIQDKVWVEEE